MFSFRTSEKPVSRYAPGSRFALGLLLVSAGFCFTAPRAKAQEPPYQVTYSDSLEEPGNLEVAFKADEGNPKNGNRFESGTVELEYGATAWWTTEFYLQGQTTKNDSTIFTGVRWENRFRPLLGDHFINPVLYLEYEDVSAADRSLLEITGHASIADLVIPNGVERPPSRAFSRREADSLEQLPGLEHFREFHLGEGHPRKRPLGVRLRSRRQPSSRV